MHCATKTLDLDAIGGLDAESAIAELLKVRGIGRWSAEIYAMFALGHTDIFPAGDLALQVAVQRYESLGERPDVTKTDRPRCEKMVAAPNQRGVVDVEILRFDDAGLGLRAVGGQTLVLVESSLSGDCRGVSGLVWFAL